MASGIEIRRISDEAGFRALAPYWNGLLASSAAPGFFLTWDWIETWWDHYGPGFDLFVLAAIENGVPVALAPLVLRKGDGARLEMIGQNRAYGEYLDFIMPAGREAEFAGLFSRHLAAAREAGLWQRMVLAVVREDMQALATIRAGLASHGIETRVSEPRISPVVTLGCGWRDALARREAAFVKRLSYNIRRLNESGPLRFEVAATAAEADDCIADLVALNEERWGQRLDPQFVAFHRALVHRLLPRGELLLARLSVGGEVVAAKYDFVFARRIWGYQGGWSKTFARFEVGSLLLLHVMDYGAARGLGEYDFLEGNEWYKRRWSSHMIVSRDIVVGDAGPPYVF
jgi:CelD/BcsL family acetyltransferase involved in cellulose biosynthesis